MRAVYGRSEQEYSVRNTRRKSGRRKQERGVALGRREKQRLLQLFICILLFLAAFVGKGVYPQRMENWKEDALAVLHTDTDFKAVFVGLGRAVSDGEPMLDTLGELWVDVFNGGTVSVAQRNSTIQAPIYQQECAVLAAHLSGKELLIKRLGLPLETTQAIANATAAKTMNETENTTVNETVGWEEREDVSQPVLLKAQPQPAYNGPALPAGCTMDNLSLQLSETMTPVLGVISSGYGYRIHPVDGEYKFHYGADIAADVGTPVAAFAAGVVDYIGESEIYGQYVQLCHEGGVTTFYAHCNKLYVKDGQKIFMGDTIAEVGQSGNVTGPHLHFEIRLNGVYLNPLNYIDTL